MHNILLCAHNVMMSRHACIQIGNLSKKTRVVRIKNVLTDQVDAIEVPSEESITEIRERCVM